MDVRCDRCQTEYELDDESIGGSGASVQCTTCGHTFVVSRHGAVTIGKTPPGGLGRAETPPPEPRVSQHSVVTSMPVADPPAVPEWVLATEEGQTHRLRDLTTLQKWVVERRVTRGDRVSHRGGAWRALGELEELRPFFDVVDQADRHTGAGPVSEPARISDSRAVRATMPGTPRSVGTQSRQSPLEVPDEADLTARARRSRSPQPFLEASIADAPDDEDLSMALKPRRTGLKVFGALLFVGAAAGAAWFMFKDPHAFHLKSGTPVPTSAPTASSTAAAAPPAAAPTPPPAAAPAPTAAPTPAAAPVPKPVAEAPAPEPKPAAKAAETKAAETKPAETKSAEPKAAPEAKGRSYEQLVSEADRALENGQSVKAQKLYDEALRQQPRGVAALTGSAYVLLDRHRSLAAIGLFKQVLSNAPHYAPALFGLGEAYRSQGEAPQAVDAYKNYLEQSPTGTDAPAARRQIKELGEAAAAPRNPGPTATIPEGASNGNGSTATSPVP